MAGQKLTTTKNKNPIIMVQGYINKTNLAPVTPTTKNKEILQRVYDIDIFDRKLWTSTKYYNFLIVD
jgi:hypothetical protein